ncbi:60S ribosomal L15 [Tubulinosema ratisbonensis]|uniref:Ribosomal protein L15 n=1 Tax=Tubulinosema ratisbonensis TaxID=291195 RepID=A0A437AM51_9MICR|nr:60S ribosomal L15 [Tubulinosema ratisbonensis]
MSAMQYLREIRKKKLSDLNRYLYTIRCYQFRLSTAVHKADKPTYIDKARQLGYKAKEGYSIYRVRIKRGGRKKLVNNGNTRGKCVNAGIYEQKPSLNLQGMAEIKLGKKIRNLRILNSYWVGQDGTYKYYEVIMVDPLCQRIRDDPRINWICNPVMKHRECRGLTSATKKSRGLGKGIRYNQTIGGSRYSCWKRRNTVSLKKYR